MTLSEAIAHEDWAANTAHGELAAEHAQMRDWLRELERLRSARDVWQENDAKLRELVADMWRFTGTACKKYPRLFDPAAQGGQMVWPNMLDSFEQRIRELGVKI